MKDLEERIKKLKELGVKHRAIDRVRIFLMPAVESVLKELEEIFMKIELTLPELEGRLKALERRLKTLEDEIAYLEEVMARHGLFKIMAEKMEREEVNG